MTEEPDYNQEDLTDHNGVSAIIRDKEGKILVQNHTKYGFWTIPVGKVALGKSIIGGLKEELAEECGIVVEEQKELGRKSYTYNRNGKQIKLIGYLFEITKYSGKVENKEPQKHNEQVFMSEEKIRNLPYLSDMTLYFLERNGYSREARL